jgi:hypothetical protein
MWLDLPEILYASRLAVALRSNCDGIDLIVERVAASMQNLVIGPCTITLEDSFTDL